MIETKDDYRKAIERVMRAFYRNPAKVTQDDLRALMPGDRRLEIWLKLFETNNRRRLSAIMDGKTIIIHTIQPDYWTNNGKNWVTKHWDALDWESVRTKLNPSKIHAAMQRIDKI